MTTRRQPLWLRDTAPGSADAAAGPAGGAGGQVRACPAPHRPVTTRGISTDYVPCAAEVGQTAYYAVRWLSTRGAPGPWSLVTGYPVI